MTRRTFPSDFASWRDALVFIAGNSPEFCACGAAAVVMRHVGGGELPAPRFACASCAEDVLESTTGQGFYVWTAEGFEPWENVVDNAKAPPPSWDRREPVTIHCIYRTRYGMTKSIAMANDLDGLMRRFVKLTAAFRRIAPHLPIPYHVATMAARAVRVAETKPQSLHHAA